MRRMLPFAIVILMVFPAGANESFQALFAKANKHFESGDFKAASELYESIYKQGVSDKSVFYNLGNSMLKMGHLGEAIYYYRKALRIDPRDADVLTNLNIARSLVPRPHRA